MSLSYLDALNFKSNMADTESFEMRDGKPAKNLGELSRLPTECKEKFMELKKEQGVILHDSLEQKERYVCKLLANAVSCLKVFPQLDDVRDDNASKRLKLFHVFLHYSKKCWQDLMEYFLKFFEALQCHSKKNLQPILKNRIKNSYC